MKKTILRQLLMLSKRVLYGFLIQFFFCTVLLANTGNAQRKTLEEVKISVKLTDKSLSQFFRLVEARTDFKFTYNNNLVDLKRRVSVLEENSSLYDILITVSRQTDLKFVQVNENIHVKEDRITEESVDVVQSVDVLITGIVKDENGEPIPGATILIEGTNSGTATDIDGNFRVDAQEGAVLLISFIGYQSQRVTVGNQSNISIVLMEDQSSLDEVVVVGYGTARRKDISGAIGTVKLEDSEIGLSQTTNILQALQGTVAGVNVGPQNSPGRTPEILVRGQNSINGTNEPLVVLDGMIYLGNIADINPDDIATIDVLKDASSAAVYGSRSANGVLVITTKTGKTDKPIIKYDGSVGVNRWQNKFEMMNLDRWAEKYVAQQPTFNDPSEIIFDDVTRTRLYQQGVDTDWMDLISRNGLLQNHQVSVAGRSDRINYYFSGGFNSNEGVIVGDQFQRISLRSKLDADVTNWLKVGVDGAYNNNDFSGLAAGPRQAYQLAPHGYPYRWPTMPENPESNTGTLLERYPSGSSIKNALWPTNDEAVQDIDRQNFYRVAAYAAIQVPKVDGLTYRFNYSINANSNIQDRFFNEMYYAQEQLVEPFINRYSPTQLSQTLAQANGFNRRTNYYTYVMDNIVNYNKQLGNHYFDATLVATRDFSYTKFVEATGNDFSGNGNTLLGVDGLSKATVQRVNMNVVERANVGYLGRINYAFKDKYNMTASLRRDGASVFGADKKWANFGSVGVSWILSEEGFMEDVDYLDFFKVKASYGRNGNQGVSPYATLARVASGSDGGIRYQFGDAPSRILYGVKQTNLGSPELGWETTTAFNGGFQSAWLNGRVILDLDFYFSSTTDQIFLRQIPIMTGFNSIFSSLGQVDNRGIEISLRTTNISKGDFTWSSSVMFWQNRNKLARLYGDDLSGDGREDDDLANGLFIGEPLFAIYGYEYDGVVQETDTEYIANIGAIPGDAKYKDISGPDGVPDGIITADYDRRILGYRGENFRLNLSNTVRYKNFSLYVMLTGIFGGGKDNFYQGQNPRHNSFSDRFDTNELDNDWWTPENKSDYYLRPNFVDNRYLGLQSRGFVRIQDVNLSYAFPKALASSLSVSSLEIYSSIYNLHTFTNWYGGGDPELGIRPGDQTLPLPSTYSLGLKIGF